MQSTLTESDLKKLKTWFDEKIGGMRCPCCGHDNTLGVYPNFVVALHYDAHSTRFYYGYGISLIASICSQCAHTMFFSAEAMGFKADIPAAQPVS